MKQSKIYKYLLQKSKRFFSFDKLICSAMDLRNSATISYKLSNRLDFNLQHIKYGKLKLM